MPWELPPSIISPTAARVTVSVVTAEPAFLISGVAVLGGIAVQAASKGVNQTTVLRVLYIRNMIAGILKRDSLASPARNAETVYEALV
jgi:hypothetical protein